MKYITTPDNYLKITESSTVDNVYFLTADPAAIVSSLGNTVRAISSNDKDPITAVSRLTISDAQTTNPKIAINCPIVKSVSSADDFIEITGSATDPLIGIKDGAIVKSVSSADSRVGVIGTPAEPEIKLNVNVVESVSSDDARIIVEGTVNPKISLDMPTPVQEIQSTATITASQVLGIYKLNVNDQSIVRRAPEEGKTFTISTQYDMDTAMAWANGFGWQTPPSLTLKMTNENPQDFIMRISTFGGLNIHFASQDNIYGSCIGNLEIQNEGPAYVLFDGLHCTSFQIRSNGMGFYEFRNLVYNSLTQLRNVERPFITTYGASKIHIDAANDFSAIRWNGPDNIDFIGAFDMSEIWWDNQNDRIHELPGNKHYYFRADNGGRLTISGSYPSGFSIPYNIRGGSDNGIVSIDRDLLMPIVR
jgi:hypothetical protein